MTEETLFHEALAKANAQERAAFLDAACAGQPELQAAVEALLAAHAAADHALDRPAVAPRTQAVVDPTDEFDARGVKSGLFIAGRYTLQEKIGEGGMGDVWVARQSEPVKRKVALKLVKPGMDSRAVVQRFEQERQALALMDHPNIARVFDGGLTNDQRPFFVMELVNGLKLTRFCDEAKLGIPARLELFIALCHAVQHAHQKGIVHRDLKPSNILVTVIDGKPVPKIIDFGVAKALGGKLTEESLSTQFGAVVGTLEYMAPEQAGYSGADVDTRADVYALGVILYELLTGLQPFDGKRLRQAAVDEMIRMIREEEPPAPSTRLSSNAGSPSLAAARLMEPGRLAKLLRGELDWVVLKCLEKQRDRRYETASGLARDVERYLADEPVEARPPSAGYRLGKFLRRNRGRVVATGLVLLALLGGVLGAAYGWIEAQRQREVHALWQQTEQERDAAVAARADEVRAKQQAEIAREKAEQARGEETAAKQQAEEAREKLAAVEYGRTIEVAHQDWKENDIVGAMALLDSTRSDFRGWEWRYLRRLCHCDVEFRGHVGVATGLVPGNDGRVRVSDVTGLAFHPDGSRVASISAAEARVWDSATGREYYKIDHPGVSPQKQAVGVAYSVDGRRLAVAWSDFVSVHDALDGKEILHLDPLKKIAGLIKGVAFGPDGRVLAMSSHGSDRKVGVAAVKLWNLETAAEVQRFPETVDYVSGAALSPDGKYVAGRISGGYSDGFDPGELHLWDATSGERLHTFRGSDAQPPRRALVITDAAFSPDSKRMALSTDDGAVLVWDFLEGRHVFTVSGHKGEVPCTAFSPRGDWLASAGEDRIVRVWDAATGAEVMTFRGHTVPVRGVAFSRDGERLASAGGEVRIWDLTASQQARNLVRAGYDKHGGPSLAFSPDGKVLASTQGGKVNIHETGTGRQLDGIPQPSIHEGLSELRRQQTPASAPGSDPEAERVAFSPDGSVMGMTTNYGVKLWDPQMHKTVSLFMHYPELRERHVTTSGFAFSPDGRRLATAGRGRLTVWDAATAKELYKISPAGDCVVFSPDGRDLAVSTACVPFSEYSWGSVFTRNGVPGPENWEPNRPIEIAILDAGSGKELMRLPDGGAELAYSPDGSRLAAARVDGTVKIWDTATWEIVLVLRGHTGAVYSLAYSSDGRRIVTGSADQTVRLWDSHLGPEVLTLRGHDAPVVCVRFSADGRYLASASSGKPNQVRVWDAGSPR